MSDLVKVLATVTCLYAHPEGPHMKPFQLYAQKEGVIHKKNLKQFKEVDPDGEVLDSSDEVQDEDETENLDEKDVQKQVDPTQNETQVQDDDEEKEEEGEQEEDGEEDEEEDAPKKKTKFLKGKKGK